MDGPPYEGAVRLAVIAAEHWAAIDGEAASRGVDYLTLPVDRLLNAVYWWAVQRVSDPAVFTEQLDLPFDADPTVVTQAELDRDAQAFMAFAAAMGAKPPTPAALPSSTSTEAEASEG